MTEAIQEKFVTTEQRHFLRAEGWNFYMALQCSSDENIDIFDVIDHMKFKLIITYCDGECNEYSEMVELFETSEWVNIETYTEKENGFISSYGELDIYELTGDSCYSNAKLYQCLSYILPESEEESEEEYDRRTEYLHQEFIDQMTNDGDLDQLTKTGIVQYIKAYF